MNVKVERLRLEIFFSQPHRRCNRVYCREGRLRPVRGWVNVPYAVRQQTEQEGTFPFQAYVDGFLHVNCTKIPEEEGTISSQADVGVKPETTTTTAQVAACKEFARPPKNRQQRRVTAWGAEQTKQFDPGG